MRFQCNCMCAMPWSFHQAIMIHIITSECIATVIMSTQHRLEGLEQHVSHTRQPRHCPLDAAGPLFKKASTYPGKPPRPPYQSCSTQSNGPWQGSEWKWTKIENNFGLESHK